MASRSGQKLRPPSATITTRSLTWIIFGIIFALRVANALTIQTFFQPDEYFQSLEPAWQSAFGNDSGAWLTWEWREQLRSALHPLLFAGAYRVTNQTCILLGLSRAIQAELLLAAPKVLQAIIASVMDVYTWKLASIAYGQNSPESFAALALTVCSPWQWYSSTRTFSNTLETALSVVGLAVWPWQWFLNSPGDDSAQRKQQRSAKKADIDLGKILRDDVKFPDASQRIQKTSSSSKAIEAVPANLHVAIIAVACACILRPTNAIIWLTIVVTLLLRYGSYSKVSGLLQAVLFSGISVLVVAAAVDRAYFGVWTLPPLRFLYFNLVQSLAIFYGRNRHDYYFTEGLPLLLTTALPFAVIGFWRALRPGPDRQQLAGYYERQTRFTLAVAVATTVLAFSIIAHKEMRFIYPLLPILHVLAAGPLATLFSPFPLPKSKTRLGLLLFGFTLNVYIAAYVTLVHQRGVIDVMHFLRHEAGTDTGVKNITVGFLMPCHSTPWRSHFVYPEINAWALTCEPPINLSEGERRDYLDEADVFYADPASWLEDNMASRESISREVSLGSTSLEAHHRAWPDYLVFFEALEPVIASALERSQYRECWRGFNTHWLDDGRRRGDVIVQCLGVSDTSNTSL